MYSQQSSENPIRTKTQKIFSQSSKFKFPTAVSDKLQGVSGLAKPIKSVCITVLAVILFVGFVMGAYCIEGSINVGFKPDFQHTQPSYSSVNSLFDKYENMLSVKIKVHGQNEFSVYTPAVTVGEVIDKLSLTLDANDVISTPRDSDIEDGMVISIDRVETNTHTDTVTVPYGTKIIESQTIPKGTRRTIQKGVNGTSTQNTTEVYVNGTLSKKEVTTETKASEPIEEIVEVGVGGTYTDSYGISYEYSYYIDVTATAYGTCSGVTATGKAVDYGMIAVDPSVIPLGTKVYLTGSWGDMGVCSAEDTGGAIKGNKIDVFLGDDYNRLMAFGRRSMRVYILA